jgi:serine/threonine protein kinase
MLGLEVTRKVASGSVVEAFLAKANSDHILVQVTRPELSADHELYKRFLAFSKTNTELNHPALLSAHVAHCSHDGRLVLMTGPVSGRTAADALSEQGTFSPRDVLRFGMSICDALIYLHERRLVHGHLAPSNVFLEGDRAAPQVKLLNTGLLLFRADRSLEVPSTITLVPPEYLSPERVRGHRATQSSDVYGMGVLLFELLTGQPPFRGPRPADTRELHLASPPPLLPGSLSSWRPILARCLAKAPEQRFASIRELKVALESAATDSTPAVVPSPLRQAADLSPGDTLGRYQIESQLGEGGMGRIFLAKHAALGRPVAIKVLRAELARHPEQVRRFVQEAQTGYRAHHPNIVDVFDLVQESEAEGGRVYFVMEALSGGSLKDVGRKGPFTLARAVRVISEVARALAAAHAVGIIHRDIKPDNVFLVEDADGVERVKVLDFGVARIIDATGSPVRNTQVGQVVGTPLWMAPEQILGAEVDARADIYSVASLLFVLLKRKFPFEGANTSELIMQRLQADGRPVGDETSSGERIPSELPPLMAQSLPRDVARRPSPMNQVVRRLARVSDLLTARQVSQSRATPPVGAPGAEHATRAKSASTLAARAEAPKDGVADPNDAHAEYDDGRDADSKLESGGLWGSCVGWLRGGASR